MKRSKKIAFSGLLAATAVVIMLAAYFPYLTYAIPAVAGLFIAILAVELDGRWAFGAYLVSAVLTLLFAEMEAKLLYVFFFGYYPVVKFRLERLRAKTWQYVCKFALFNAATVAVFAGLTFLFQIPLEEMAAFGVYGTLIFLLLANVVFLLYDITVSRLLIVYHATFHRRLQRLLK